MRWIVAVVGVLVFAQCTQAQDDAKKLYEAMEQKITKAKAYTFEYTHDFQEDDDKMAYQGVVAVATNNRLKVSMKGMTRGRAMTGFVVCDGKTLAEEMELAEGTHREKMPSDGTTTVAFADWLVRAGVFECFGNVLDRTKPRDVGKLKVSDFKTIGKEKVANRATTIIQLKIEGLDYPNGVTCKLWLDDQLNVPLKRLAEGVKGNFRLLETYGQWNFDPKQPDNTFTLPK